MFHRSLIIGLLLASALSAAAEAAEPPETQQPEVDRTIDRQPEVDRTIDRQPEYDGEPKYFLMVFGPQAATRLWCVYDGDVLYVDRNGNGDLTEENERLAADSRTGTDLGGYPAEGGTFLIGDITETDGTTTHKGLTVSVRIPRQYPEHGSVQVEVLLSGEHSMTAVIPNTEALLDPATAPVRHFGGQLTPRLTGDSGELRLGERPAVITFWLGTVHADAGEGTVLAEDGTVLSYRGIPRSVHPVARVSCAREGGGEPIEWEVSLTERCCENQFYGAVPVPAEAASGPATLTLSYANWQGLPIEPATYDITIVEPSAAGVEAVEVFQLQDLDAD